MNNLAPNAAIADSTIEQYKELNGRVSKKVKELLYTVSSHSNFLSRVLVNYPEIAKTVVKLNGTKPKKTHAVFTKEATTLCKNSRSTDEVMACLRRYKYTELTRIIYNDIRDPGSFTGVMEELSDLASAMVEALYRYHSNELDSESQGEFVVLGMGKLGGRELNLSSDIDLIYLFRDRGEPDVFFKLAERITKSLASITEDRFLYRVDLGLRPGGNKSAIAIHVEGAIEHYYYWGDTWERAALIKTRPVAGELSLGEEFVTEIEPFVYKKHLDFSSIEDLKDMKTKLDQLKKIRDVKLGKGGIREIEFFVQALQLVNGGEIKQIRGTNTLKVLDKLERVGIVDSDVRESLARSYIFLRRVEHSIQLADEIQTHKIPTDSTELDHLAKRCGYPSTKEFQSAMKDHTREVTRVYKSLFHEPSSKTEEIGKEFWEIADFLTEGNIDEEQAIESLANLGFQNPVLALELISILLDPRRGALTQEGRTSTRRVVPAFLANILKSSEPDSAIVNLERFISGIGWRTSIYSVLSENPEIIELLSKLFSTSGYLSNFLIRHPEYLDLLTLRDVRTEFKTKDELMQSLMESLNQEQDYENKLDTLRRFRYVETLKICLRDLNNEVDPFYVGNYLAILAESILEAGLVMAYELVGKKPYKKTQRHDMMILGMGKLGGKEMSYNSDLDVIMIYEGDDHEYYSKLGQRLISILSVPTGEGYAYKIDMDLRPSGRSGALVTSFDSFKNYHNKEAKLWERQALIRAAPVAGDIELGKKVMRTVNRFVYTKPLAEDYHLEIDRLRKRMEVEIAKESTSKRNLKTGRGGLVDIEFLVQMLQLKYGRENKKIRRQNTLAALTALYEGEFISDREYSILREGLEFLKKLENLLRLLHNRSINELKDSDFSKLRIEKDGTDQSAMLRDKYVEKTNKIREIYDKYFQQ